MALRQIQRKYSKFISNACKKSSKKYSKFISDACKNSSKIGNRSEESDLHTFHRNRSYTNINDDPIPPAPFRYKFKHDDDDDRRWFHNPKRVGFALFFFTCGALLGIDSGKSVTVPYTERRHFILFHKFLPKILQEAHTTFEDELLPPFHRHSITARRIFQNIMEIKLPLGENQSVEKANCEIIVLHSVEAFVVGSGRFGKMYVSSMLLHLYERHEPMIATILGAEVGRGLARHIEEKFSKFISVVSITGMSVYLFWQSDYIRSKMPSLVKLMRLRFLPSFSFLATVTMLSYFPIAKYYRRMEYEADHIGLMMAASAGYDPEEGLGYPVHVGVIDRNTVLPECFYLSPSLRARNLYLAQPQVFAEAIVSYHWITKQLPGDETD